MHVMKWPVSHPYVKDFLGVFFGIALILFLIAVGWSSAPKKTPVAVTQPACNVDAGILLTEINAERSKLGVPQLSIDSTLATTSKQKLDDMVGKKYFGHDLPDGSNFSVFIRNAGIHAAASEDVAENTFNPENTWESYKASPSHYKSLTDPQFTRVGISTQCVTYVVQTSTGPDDNSSLVGKTVTDLTVVQLASPEPAPQPQVQTKYVPAPNSSHIGPSYSQTNCTENLYGTGVSCSTTSY